MPVRISSVGDLMNAMKRDTNGELRWHIPRSSNTTLCKAPARASTCSFQCRRACAPQGLGRNLLVVRCMCSFCVLVPKLDTMLHPSCRPADTAGLPAIGRGKQIALDVARGLAFLHTHRVVHLVRLKHLDVPCHSPARQADRSAVVHLPSLLRQGAIITLPRKVVQCCGAGVQDIKSPNILLDGRWVAKIADVGLAKLQHNEYLSMVSKAGTFTWSASPHLIS